jgi:hypothetical protein
MSPPENNTTVTPPCYRRTYDCIIPERRCVRIFLASHHTLHHPTKRLDNKSHTFGDHIFLTRTSWQSQHSIIGLITSFSWVRNYLVRYATVRVTQPIVLGHTGTTAPGGSLWYDPIADPRCILVPYQKKTPPF